MDPKDLCIQETIKKLLESNFKINTLRTFPLPMVYHCPSCCSGNKSDTFLYSFDEGKAIYAYQLFLSSEAKKICEHNIKTIYTHAVLPDRILFGTNVSYLVIFKQLRVIIILQCGLVQVLAAKFNSNSLPSIVLNFSTTGRIDQILLPELRASNDLRIALLSVSETSELDKTIFISEPYSANGK